MKLCTDVSVHYTITSVPKVIWERVPRRGGLSGPWAVPPITHIQQNVILTSQRSVLQNVPTIMLHFVSGHNDVLYRCGACSANSKRLSPNHIQANKKYFKWGGAI